MERAVLSALAHKAAPPPELIASSVFAVYRYHRAEDGAIHLAARVDTTRSAGEFGRPNRARVAQW